MTEDTATLNQVCNVSVGEHITLNELFKLQPTILIEHFPQAREYRPQYKETRKGDQLHSQANISKAWQLFGCAATHRVGEGPKEAMDWYIRTLSRQV